MQYRVRPMGARKTVLVVDDSRAVIGALGSDFEEAVAKAVGATPR
jgi:hypothetical protein